MICWKNDKENENFSLSEKAKVFLFEEQEINILF